jgi:hypothetical protein
MGNFAGVDWAVEKHDVLVADPAGEELVCATFAHDESGLRALCGTLVRLVLKQAIPWVRGLVHEPGSSRRGFKTRVGVLRKLQHGCEGAEERSGWQSDVRSAWVGRRVTRSDRCSGLLVRRPVWPVVDRYGGLLLGWSEGVGQAEERSEPWVVGEDAPPYAPAGGDDLCGDLYERLAEGAELHGEQALAVFVVAFGPAWGDG